MRIQKLALALFVFVITAITGIAFASSSSWWHGLSQTSRNNKILDRTFDDLNDYVGVECKHWVQNVVYDASHEVVWLPQTKPNKYQWYSSSNVQAMAQPFPINWVTPGQIIQMKWGSSPHTAIVVSKNSSGMTWIDSNWGSPTGNCIVKQHTVSYNNFYNNVGSYYTVYNVR